MIALRTSSLCLSGLGLLLVLLTACAPNSAASPAARAAPEAIAEPAADANLIRNPGFEDLPYIARPWETLVHAHPESYEFSLDTEQPRSGAHAVRIRRLGEEPWAGIVQIYRYDQAEPRALQASVWLNLDAIEDHVIFYVAERPAAGTGETTRQRLERPAEAQGWRRYQLRLPPVSGRGRLQFGVEMYGPGEVLIDDAALVWAGSAQRNATPGLRH